MGNIGMGDWLIIFGIILLLFGAKRLPELAKGIGKSVHAFKQGLNEMESEVNKEPDEKKS